MDSLEVATAVALSDSKFIIKHGGEIIRVGNINICNFCVTSPLSSFSLRIHVLYLLFSQTIVIQIKVMLLVGSVLFECWVHDTKS